MRQCRAFQLFVLNVSLAAIALAPNQCVAQVTGNEMRASLVELHERLEQTRREIYGNCSYTVTETLRAEGSGLTERQQKPIKTVYKVWARDGRYLRADVLLPEHGGEVSRRYVVRPEGYCRLSRNRETGKLVVIDWKLGDPEAGVRYLAGVNAFEMSTRFSANKLELWFGEAAGLPGFGDSSENTATFEMYDFKREGETLSYKCKMERSRELTVTEKGVQRTAMRSATSATAFDVDLSRGGGFTQITSEGTVTDDGRTTPETTTVVAKYDDGLHRVIPRSVVQEYKRKQWTTTTEWITSDLNLEPASLELFEVEGLQFHPDDSRWVRRLIWIAAAGLLFGVYTYAKRKSDQ